VTLLINGSCIFFNIDQSRCILISVHCYNQFKSETKRNACLTALMRRIQDYKQTPFTVHRKTTGPHKKHRSKRKTVCTTFASGTDFKDLFTLRQGYDYYLLTLHTRTEQAEFVTSSEKMTKEETGLRTFRMNKLISQIH
jgi:hypothetical protein